MASSGRSSEAVAVGREKKSMNADRVFVDTNVLTYLFDDAEPEKQKLAGERLRAEQRGRELVVSTQVLPHYIGRIFTHPLGGYLRDIGTPNALLAAEREFSAYLRRQAGLQ